MDRRTANICLSLIIETLAEAPRGVPSGHIYAALMTAGISLDDYQGLLGIARECGLVEVRNHLVTISPKGLEMAAQIKAHKEKP